MPVQAGQPRHRGGVGGGEIAHVRVLCYFRGALQWEGLDPQFVYSETEIVASWLSASRFLGSVGLHRIGAIRQPTVAQDDPLIGQTESGSHGYRPSRPPFLTT